MNKPIVVVDTNSCRSNPESNSFFGNRDRLIGIASGARLIIPKVVVDEITNQKMIEYTKNKGQLKTNSIICSIGMDMSIINKFDIKSHIESLKSGCLIDFEEYELKRINIAYKKMYGWAIKHEPPFEERGDKGFKDAYIACSIEELIKDNRGIQVFLISKDVRLIERFKDNSEVITLNDFEDIDSYLFNSFVDDYLLSKIRNELDIADAIVSNGWLNIDDNWVLVVMNEVIVKYVIVDRIAREILDSTIYAFKEDVEFFVQSSSFAHTHAAIDVLSETIQYVSKDDMLRIIICSLSNSQIYSVGMDDDVREFLLPIFEKVKSYLDESDILKFSDQFKANK